MSEMRDANMPLLDRIEAVQQRIQNGHALRRIPVEATDGDVVLSDCAKELARLRAECDALRADAERYRWMKQNVKRIPPVWEMIGWDAAIDAAREGKRDE